MAWIPLVAWAAAVVVAVVVLGFCGYEVAWKTRRLRRDTAALSRLADDLQSVRAQLDATRARVAAVTAGEPG